jgi:hypothetical protein
MKPIDMSMVSVLTITSAQQKVAGRTYYMRLEGYADFSKRVMPICYGQLSVIWQYFY